jgi:hypothetical protein
LRKVLYYTIFTTLIQVRPHASPTNCYLHIYNAAVCSTRTFPHLIVHSGTHLSRSPCILFMTGPYFRIYDLRHNSIIISVLLWIYDLRRTSIIIRPTHLRLHHRQRHRKSGIPLGTSGNGFRLRLKYGMPTRHKQWLIRT